MGSDEQSESPIGAVMSVPCDAKKYCCSSGRTRQFKTIIFTTVMLLAVAVAFYSSTRRGNPSEGDSSDGNTAIGLAELRLESIEEAERLAAKQDVTFLLLPGRDASLTMTAQKQLLMAFDKLVSQGRKVAAFTVPEETGANQTLRDRFHLGDAPCVVTLGKGGLLAVAGEIDETKLLGAAITAGLCSRCGCRSAAAQ